MLNCVAWSKRPNHYNLHNLWTSPRVKGHRGARIQQKRIEWRSSPTTRKTSWIFIKSLWAKLTATFNHSKRASFRATLYVENRKTNNIASSANHKAWLPWPIRTLNSNDQTDCSVYLANWTAQLHWLKSFGQSDCSTPLAVKRLKSSGQSECYN